MLLGVIVVELLRFCQRVIAEGLFGQTHFTFQRFFLFSKFFFFCKTLKNFYQAPAQSIFLVEKYENGFRSLKETEKYSNKIIKQGESIWQWHRFPDSLQQPRRRDKHFGGSRTQHSGSIAKL